ncbi:MAG TPA: hypothetical protein VGT40_21550 [Methylomirabilota bacterium]|nr:hypothetical protein [Methylomirabilota bacterium]
MSRASPCRGPRPLRWAAVVLVGLLTTVQPGAGGGPEVVLGFTPPAEPGGAPPGWETVRFARIYDSIRLRPTP